VAADGVAATQFVPFVDLGAQLKEIRSEIDDAISTVLSRSDYILGDSVHLFEEEYADYCQTSFAVGVDSGTSGLELALAAFGVGEGDEVITVANTFIATALAISHVGASPVLVDTEPNGYGLDASQVERAISAATKAIVPVHLYGYPVDVEPLMDLAESRGLVVIEDASQAHGARIRGRRVGSVGHAGVFSLYPAKNLGAFGDAGVIVTDNPEIDAALRLARNYGSPVKYYHQSKGHNRRLDTLQAAILRVKLRYLDSWNEARRARAASYDALLARSTVVTPPPVPSDDQEAVYHVYVIRSPSRDGLQRHLAGAGVSTVIHYPVPIHLQPAYEDLGHSVGDFPVAERYAREVLSLPMYPELTHAAIEHVVESIETYADPVPAALRVTPTFTAPKSELSPSKTRGSGSG
jgi:dTDP-4-amino-4,6-dideoxygalactose transaminase